MTHRLHGRNKLSLHNSWRKPHSSPTRAIITRVLSPRKWSDVSRMTGVWPQLYSQRCFTHWSLKRVFIADMQVVAEGQKRPFWPLKPRSPHSHPFVCGNLPFSISWKPWNMETGEYSLSLWKQPVQPAVVVSVASLVLQVRGWVLLQRINAFLILAELKYVDAEYGM